MAALRELAQNQYENISRLSTPESKCWLDISPKRSVSGANGDSGCLPSGCGSQGIPDPATDPVSPNSSGIRDGAVLHVANLQVISESEVIG